MEPDDLSFIEISGEDDSLLPPQNMRNDDISSLNNSYFALSLLQIPRSACSVNPPPLVSPIASITGNEDAGKMDLLSSRDSLSKENVNSNKPEVPKLSMEPQQMKRKKKSGGYNLRKSLAWDKAFFSEEGVLDPLELSMISGNFGTSSGEMLSVIEEDGGESLVGDSEDLTAQEENFFKALSTCNVSKDRKRSGTLLPKNGSSAGVSLASASAAKRKVLSAHDVNRSGSKRGGCPRPVASSSLKKPANANTTKSAIKESQVSKIPVRKLDTFVHAATVKNNIPRASNSKQNQIAQQAAVGVQRNVGLKGSSNINKNVRSDLKSGLAGRSAAVKSSVQQAKRNVSSSALKIPSATNSQNPPVSSKANDALKMDPGLLPPTSGHKSNNHDSVSNKVAISLPRGGSMQNTQLQTAKPSGLRMPSPSLGFFNRSKATASHSSLLGSNQGCNIPGANIPNFRKFGAINAIQETPLPASGKRAGVVNGVTANDMRIPSSLRGSSIPTSLSTNACEKMKSNLNIHEIQKVDLDVQSNSNSHGILNNQQKLHSLCNDIDQQSLENARPSKNEKISHVVHNDNKLLLQSAPGDQLQKDRDDDRVYPMNVDLSGPEQENPHFLSHLNPTIQAKGVFETKDMIDNQCTEEKTCNSSIKDFAASLESQSGDANSHSIKGTEKRSDDWSSSVHDVDEQAEMMMPCTHQVEQISSEGRSPWLNNGNLSNKSSSSEFQNCKSAKIEGASPEVRHSGDGVVEISHGQPHSKETVEAVDSQARVHFLTKSQAGDAEVQSVDGILSAGSGEVVLWSSVIDKMVVDDVNGNVIDANGSELKSSDTFCSIPPAVQDCGFDMAKTAEGRRGDDAISGFTDAQFSHDIKLHGQPTSEESEMIGKDQTTMVMTANVEVSNIYPNIADFGGCELDLQHFATQPGAVEQTKNNSEVKNIISAMQVKNDNGIVDVSEPKDVGNKHYVLSVSNHCPNSDLQPADDISHCQQSASIVYNDYGCKQTVEGNQNPVASDEPWDEDGMPFEESGENTGKVADVSLDVSSYSERRLESLDGLFEHEYAEQGNEEVAGFDNTNKTSFAGDAEMQILEGTLLVDGCNSNFNAADVDDTHEQSGVHPEFHNSDLAAVEGSMDAHGLCLNNKLIVKKCYSEEYQDKNVCGSLMDSVLEQSDVGGNESRSSVVCTQPAAAVREGGIDEDQKADWPSKGVENVQNIGLNILKTDLSSEEAGISQNNGSFNYETQHESENPTFATEDAVILSSGGVFRDIEVNVLKSDVLPKDAETSISQKNGGPSCEMQHELEDAMCSTEDQDTTKFLKISGNDKKQDHPVIEPPSDAVPFSDEWLAAYEAAGEEILTKKGGAVQNSPPDKSLPESGPWSPVKRKNNQGIGPFDCTKFTNANINIPPNSS